MRRKLMADGTGSLPALEEICKACDGEGKIPHRRSERSIEFGGTCNECSGAGIRPTEDGRRLLEFLRWHQR